MMRRSCLLTLAAACAIADVPEFSHLSFETLPNGAPPAELTELSDQYLSTFGVSFELVGSTDPFPIIAVAGAPGVAFFGPGDDAPMTHGIRCLTDPDVDGAFNIGADVALDLNPPALAVRLYVIDIDGVDVVTVSAFDSGGALLDSVTKGAAPDGVSTSFVLQGPGIARIVIDVPNPPSTIGYGVDAVSIVRSISEPLVGHFVRVAQESEPDRGDFQYNILGVIRPWQASLTPADELYQYDNPLGSSWNSYLLTLVEDRSHLLFADTADGMTMFVVHDRGNGTGQASDGRAETKAQVLGDLDGAFYSATDDPSDLFTASTDGLEFTAAAEWLTCCTDGFAISGLDGDWTLLLEFAETDSNASTPVFQLLNDWVAYSSAGSEVPLTLQPDRRVQLRRIDSCIAANTPLNASACPGGTAVFSSRAASVLAPPYVFEWRNEGRPIDLNDPRFNVETSPDGITSTLTITNVQTSDAGKYTCSAGSRCGTTVSFPGRLSVCDATGDLDCDGEVGQLDLGLLLVNFGRFVPPGSLGDLDGDGVVGQLDLQLLLTAFGQKCPAPPCGDLDGDGVVGQEDLLIVLSSFGCEGDCAGDFDLDNDVDQLDLGLLLAKWGNVCK